MIKRTAPFLAVLFLVAAALLTCWGVDSPTDASKARKAIKRAK